MTYIWQAIRCQYHAYTVPKRMKEQYKYKNKQYDEQIQLK